MTAPRTRIVRHPEQVKFAKESIAYGLLNFGYAVERSTKENAVVRGGNRSFAPDGPVGGTLRRSYHAVVAYDGRVIGHTVDQNERAVPAYEGKRDAGMTLFVGSNSGYGGYVEIGTENMVGRPTLVPALVENKRRAARLIEAGARRHAGQ
jgi:hypothetical protein